MKMKEKRRLNKNIEYYVYKTPDKMKKTAELLKIWKKLAIIALDAYSNNNKQREYKGSDPEQKKGGNQTEGYWFPGRKNS